MAHILVIDDDPTIRSLIKTMLENAGYHVLLAVGGAEGLSLFKSNTIDLVITDILMPGTDGLAVIRELLASNSSAKMIALSGGGTTLTAEMSLGVAHKMGVLKSLSKPFSKTELLETVEQALQKLAVNP